MDSAREKIKWKNLELFKIEIFLRILKFGQKKKHFLSTPVGNKEILIDLNESWDDKGKMHSNESK